MAFDISIFNGLDEYFAQWVEKNGSEFIYMPRFTKDNMPFGKCTRCIDLVTNQITDAKCPTCFGTGFTGGWDAPLTGPNSKYQRVYGLLTPNKVVTDWQKTGPVANEQDQNLYIRLDQQPAISDLVIDDRGFRYRVGTSIDDWNFYNMQVGYVVTVFQQGPDNIVYQVPIPNNNMSGVSNSQGQRSKLQVFQLTSGDLTTLQRV